MNRVTLFGRLGADPEMRRSTNGTAIMRIRVATSERKKVNGNWQDHTEWHTVVIWGKRAEGLQEHLRKGTQVLVTGAIRSKEWTDRDGAKRYGTEIASEDVELGARAPSGGR